MTRTSTARPALAASLALALAGCPSTEPAPTDAGAPLDAPGLDAPASLDAAAETDAPAPPDAPPPADGGPVVDGCAVTDYPTLDATPFVRSLDRPLYMTQAPGSDDFFIVQRGGIIRVAGPDGALATSPFIDLSATTGVPTGNSEQGLLGLAFHPDYAANGLFYVAYTPFTGGAGQNLVAVGHRSASDPRRADPGVTTILSIPDFEWNHNGGCLQFGPDGELYISTGDGGGGGDPAGNGQDETQLLAKLLRIHVGPDTGAEPYTIPASNPFATTGGGVRPEIWATGLRNAWRYSFDRLTGDLWIGDVGQNAWEEVDVEPAGSAGGENYGWSECEGLVDFRTGGPCTLAGHHAPIVVTNHDSDPVVPTAGGNASLTGGYVYRGSAISGLEGAYLFGDFVAGYVAALRYCDGAVRDYREISELRGLCTGLASFAEGHDGELYLVCFGSRAGNGQILRIVAAP